MTHACSLCNGSGFDAAGLACPYSDVHRAAARFSTTEGPTVTPGPTHTVTMTLTATGVFASGESRSALAAAVQKAAMNPSVTAGALDTVGNAIVIHDQTSGVDVHVTVTRASVRHLK
jgi:hypothetical protein